MWEMAVVVLNQVTLLEDMAEAHLFYGRRVRRCRLASLAAHASVWACCP